MMGEGRSRLVRTGRLIAALLLIGFAGAPAAAHKINVFAYADGATIRGEVYARGGDPIRGATVSVFDPAGEKLGETTSDDEGRFALEARFRCDHKVAVETSDGHGAEYTVPAEELPSELPARGGEVHVPADAPSGESLDESTGDVKAGSESRLIQGELESVHKQIVGLRQQLDRYEQKIRLRDVLGAIGYIFGLAGLAFYFLGIRRKEKSRRSSDER